MRPISWLLASQVVMIAKHTERRGQVVRIPLRVREVPGSSHDPETSCPDRCFVVLLNVIVPQIR
jgi:hypothetical protein